ncbi:MAG TPA: hypothetical protein VMP08_26520 [Anaerolineae bacterium]|nr:hypothetical protein [Anaerolineae bacterium]
MTDLTGQIKDQRGGFAKLLSKLPGFHGYMEKETRRDADKIVRDAVAAKFTAQLDRLSQLQTDMLSNGGFEYVDDVEQSAVKLRLFIDRVKTAPRGYGGLFDAVQVKEDQLDQLYNFDYQLLSEVDRLAAAIDQCRVALGVQPAPPPAEGAAPVAGAAPAPTGPEALKAAMNAVRQICTNLNDLYDKRQHVLVGAL